MADGVKLDVDTFCSRLKKFYDIWQVWHLIVLKHTMRLFARCDEPGSLLMWALNKYCVP